LNTNLRPTGLRESVATSQDLSVSLSKSNEFFVDTTPFINFFKLKNH
jgi:hypothetical protein